MNINELKIIAFDLDGTITQHKQPMVSENKDALIKLGQKYKLIMVGAGQVNRIFNQMEAFPIDIIGNYGLQYGVYNKSSKSIDILSDLKFDCDKESVERRVTLLRERYGYTNFERG